MRANEFLREDDYYPPTQSDKLSVDDLDMFVHNAADEFLGEPFKAHAARRHGEVTVMIGGIYMSKDEWTDLANEFIEHLHDNERGDFRIDTIGREYVKLVLTSNDLYETTTAGAIATVSTGMQPTFTRNASIYGTDDKKKKRKKAGKYVNSKQD